MANFNQSMFLYDLCFFLLAEGTEFDKKLINRSFVFQHRAFQPFQHISINLGNDNPY